MKSRIILEKGYSANSSTMLFLLHSMLPPAHRKAKFLLHPDKLPKDLTERQSFVCKLIWDILADAWEIYAKE